MASGSKSVDETVPPKDTQQWKSLCGQVAADLLNRKRDVNEARGFAKLATIVCDFVHAETRRALARKTLGHNDNDIWPLPTA